MSFGDGEILWRPLDNPPRLVHQHFATTNLAGFGLLQRNRNIAAYQDLFNFCNQTPSVWVQPRGDWGDGDLNLVELNTHYEGLDNIVAFWSPRNIPSPLHPLRFNYTEYWTRESDMVLSANKVVATMIGGDIASPTPASNRHRFEGPAWRRSPRTRTPQAVASCSENGAILDTQVMQVPGSSTWRVMLKVDRADEDPIDLRCTLTYDGKPVTETWTIF